MDDLSSPLRVGSVLDPALDREHMDVRAYASTRNIADVKVLPGKEAIVFELSALDHARYIAAQQAGAQQGATAGAYRALVYALVSITGYDVWSGKRVPGMSWRPTRAIDGFPHPILDDREIALMHRRFGASVMIELGAIAVSRAEMGDPGNAFGGGGSYTLPPLCMDALSQTEARRAAKTQEPSAATPSVGG